MNKRNLLLFVVFLAGIILSGCAPPYDAKGIENAEVENQTQGGTSSPAGGGKAIKESQW